MSCLVYDHPWHFGEKSFIVQPLTGAVATRRWPDRDRLHRPVPITLNHLGKQSTGRHHLSIWLAETIAGCFPGSCGDGGSRRAATRVERGSSGGMSVLVSQSTPATAFPRASGCCSLLPYGISRYGPMIWSGSRCHDEIFSTILNQSFGSIDINV